MNQSILTPLLRCPECGSTLRSAPADRRLYCNRERGPCASANGFPIIDDQPALVVFERSVLSEASLLDRCGASPIRRSKRGSILRNAARKFLAVLHGRNRQGPVNARRFLRELHTLSPNPTVLIVGGGTAGCGTELLRQDVERTSVISFDIYASPETDFIADAHDIPLPDASLDGVWIQAVLEHVVQPERAVAEIHRVLKPNGLVYAEIPFMQTVHEGAYDFTRLTDTGVRWLFRSFDRVDSGTVLGPGQALLWSITAALSGLFRSKKAGNLVATLAFFWVRLFDCLVPANFAVDSACGLYFLGRRAEKPITPKEAIAAFQGAPV